jgi:phosphate transport system ATP-binding protein
MMNDLISKCSVKGKIFFQGQDLYAQSVDPIQIRRRIGMVFQKPNPLPKSIYENIAYGARVNHYRGNLNDLVEKSLKQAFLWDEVKDRLHKNALSLSGGQQQRLCIARAIGIDPKIILMDEPCSALDPISTDRIEKLLRELKKNYTIVIVTHNIQQASRLSDLTAFFNVEVAATGGKTGYLVEYAKTKSIFTSPQQEATKDYVTGRFS